MMFCDWEGNRREGLVESSEGLYRWVYGFGHLRADCVGPEAAYLEH